MSAPQFTPGPWQAKGDYTIADATTIIANVDGDTHSDGSTTYSYEFIATCEDEYGERSERSQANARLIRAAPDGYAACDHEWTLTLALIALRDAGHLTLASELARVAEAQSAFLRKARGEQ